MSNNEQLFVELIPNEEASLSGGGRRSHRYYYRNTAYADASANAYGPNTDTSTYTDAYVNHGYSSSSYSSSYASAS